jgi:hypothetical protein
MVIWVPGDIVWQLNKILNERSSNFSYRMETNMKDLVMNMAYLHGDKMGIYCDARKLLNRASVDRTIS